MQLHLVYKLSIRENSVKLIYENVNKINESLNNQKYFIIEDYCSNIESIFRKKAVNTLNNFFDN